MKEVAIIKHSDKECIVWTAENDILTVEEADFLLDSANGIGADALFVVTKNGKILASYGATKYFQGVMIKYLQKHAKSSVTLYLGNNFLKRLQTMTLTSLSCVG